MRARQVLVLESLHQRHSRHLTRNAACVFLFAPSYFLLSSSVLATPRSPSHRTTTMLISLSQHAYVINHPTHCNLALTHRPCELRCAQTDHNIRLCTLSTMTTRLSYFAALAATLPSLVSAHGYMTCPKPRQYRDESVPDTDGTLWTNWSESAQFQMCWCGCVK